MTAKPDCLATIHLRLVEAREALGLMPEQHAQQLGMSTRAYLAWEQGKRQRWTQMFLKLAAARSPISIDWLLMDKGSMFWEDPS